MKTKQVKMLSPMARLCYWIRERHHIYLHKQQGKPKPWTNDEILQSYFFTNPYRENDKTTVWFRQNVREPLRNESKVLAATIIFRWFNKVETGKALFKYTPTDSVGERRATLDTSLLCSWDSRKAKRLLSKLEKPFTGAFMIPARPGSNKIEHVCECIDLVVGCPSDEKSLLQGIKNSTLEHAHSQLVQYPYLGGFMAYEVVTDLRHTHILENASDIMTWANPGPGCARGLWRLRGKSFQGVPAAHGCKPPDGWLEQMRALLPRVNRRIRGCPKFEMRDLEHSLCEFDKYSRVLLGEGRAKRRYQGI